MDWNLIHIVKESSLNIVFVGNSLTMIAVSDTIVHAIEALKAGKNKEYIYTQYGLEIKNSIEKIEKESANKVKSKLKIKERKIKRITLHVTNGCNLQCKYCYADGGHYNTTLGRMTKKVADNFISFCIKNFDSIDIIMFFGGEPFLNLKIMDYICKEFTCKYKNNEMNYIPAFGVVTNGTILNDNIISFIDKYISIITVSVDGLDNINDINRVFKDGTGSFSKIEKFIESVKVKTKAILYFEATYTKEHIKNEYSYSHIKSDLQNKFGINGVVVNEDSINRDCIESFNFDCDDIDNISFSDLPDTFWDVLDSIAEKTGRIICPVYQRIVAISINGEIYPCHLLMGKEKVSLGNIEDKNIYNSPFLYKEFISKKISKENAVCNSCWANKICGGCAVDIFFDKENNHFRNKPNEKHCELIKKHISKIIYLIARIRKNPIMWRDLLNVRKAMWR